MRLLLGMIIGALLTVGAAYVHDMGLSSGTAGVPAAQRPMVNWDVVGENWRDLGSRVREQWNRPGYVIRQMAVMGRNVVLLPSSVRLDVALEPNSATS